MSDSTLLPIWLPQDSNDPRPLPEIIADYYDFSLAYHDTLDGRYYLIQDWIAGVSQTKEPRKFWHDLKGRLDEAGVGIVEQVRRLPYRSQDQKTYQLDCATAEILVLMLKMMSLKVGIVSELVLGKPYQQGRVLEGFVYLITADEIPGKYKIGITKNIKQRINNIKAVVPLTYQVLHLIECSNMRQAEIAFHDMFCKKRLAGEWFALTDEDIAYIRSIKSM